MWKSSYYVTSKDTSQVCEYHTTTLFWKSRTLFKIAWLRKARKAFNLLLVWDSLHATRTNMHTAQRKNDGDIHKNYSAENGAMPLAQPMLEYCKLDP